MHTEVFNDIDTLISMADSALNIDDINTELISLGKSIKSKRNEIEDLKSLMTDHRYFNASNELVDKNIEISLKNKISRLNHQIKEIEETSSSVQAREKSIYQDINTLKNKLNTNEEYLNTLTDKVKNAKNNKYYKNLLDKETTNIQELEKELENKKSLYAEVLKELELNNQASKELNNTLETEQARLKDVLDSLDNPNAYIDEDLKSRDEEKLNNLNKELEKLENRRVELLTDANMIGADAKELIINNDIASALNKIKELVTIVKNKAYMDINNLSILDEELEKKLKMMKI